jgi:hypothetical protein
MIYHHTVRAKIEVTEIYEIEVVVDSVDLDPAQDQVENAVMDEFNRLVDSTYDENLDNALTEKQVDTATCIAGWELTGTDVSGGVE